jgi:hypothetical protein
MIERTPKEMEAHIDALQLTLRSIKQQKKDYVNLEQYDMAALYLDKQIDLENLIDDYKKQLKNV